MREAIQLVESQTVWPAFNLGEHAAGKREIRVWKGCLDYQSGHAPAPKPQLAEIISAALPLMGVAPPASVTIAGADLARRFCLARVTIGKLIAAGELREVGRHSQNESPRVAYTSAAQFLERRVL